MSALLNDRLWPASQAAKQSHFDGKLMSLDNVKCTLQGDIKMMSLFQSQNDVLCKRHFDVDV